MLLRHKIVLIWKIRLKGSYSQPCMEAIPAASIILYQSKDSEDHKTFYTGLLALIATRVCLQEYQAQSSSNQNHKREYALGMKILLGLSTLRWLQTHSMIFSSAI